MIVICEQVGVARASRDPFRIFFFGKKIKEKLIVVQQQKRETLR